MTSDNSSVNVATWITAPDLLLSQLSQDDIVDRVSRLPRPAAAEAICRMIAGLDRWPIEYARKIEEENLQPFLRVKLLAHRAVAGPGRIVFHFKQLFLLLSLVVKHGDPLSNALISPEQDQELGWLCLQVSAFSEDVREVEEPFELWTQSPVATRSETALALATNMHTGNKPIYGFMGMFRTCRIFFNALPKAEAESRLQVGGIAAAFEETYGISLERCWAMAAFIGQVRYPVAPELPGSAFIEIHDLEVHGWEPNEIAAMKRVLVTSFDELAARIPADPFKELGSTYDLFVKTFAIEIKQDLIWYHGPFVIDLLIRTFYKSILASATQSLPRGQIQNVFGRAVELYIEELLTLAQSASFHTESFLPIKPVNLKKRWLERKPEFELGLGKVRQLIEVKTTFFNPDWAIGTRAESVHRKLETNLFTAKDGLGQLACYAVGRYLGLAGPAPARIQSILIVLERMPTFIPGSQGEARRTYSRLVDEYLAEAKNRGLVAPTLTVMHRQVLLLSLEEFETLVGYASVGEEFKDILDKVYNAMTGVLMPVRVKLEELGFPRATHDWLGEGFDQVFNIYERYFPRSSSDE